jgi:hypothetical protein
MLQFSPLRISAKDVGLDEFLPEPEVVRGKARYGFVWRVADRSRGPQTWRLCHNSKIAYFRVYGLSYSGRTSKPVRSNLQFGVCRFFQNPNCDTASWSGAGEGGMMWAGV